MATKKTRKPRTTVPDNETADQKFVRLANARVSKALKAIVLISNLARYAHTEDQAEKILTALDYANTQVSQAFAAKAEKSKPSFQL